jgi:glycosyltransferase involved in cell wall biosynthesis
MDAIDIVMLTRNSARMLRPCLRSVYDNVSVRRLIVVDGFSTDDTIDILEEFNEKYGNVSILQKKSSRGEARQMGIERAGTEWFMFVDSDVVLCRNWFSIATKYIREDVGAIWGVDVPGDVENLFLLKAFKWMEARVFDIRGGCHDILIRKSAVGDIKIPSELHTLEDAYIKEWIESRGYKVVVSDAAYCRHYKTIGNLLSKENRISTILELKSMRLVRERLIYAAVFGLMWLVRERGFRSEEEHSRQMGSFA